MSILNGYYFNFQIPKTTDSAHIHRGGKKKKEIIVALTVTGSSRPLDHIGKHKNHVVVLLVANSVEA